MRTLTAIAVVTLAVTAGAAAAQDDRYGPASAPGEYASAQPNQGASAPNYQGPYLSWSAKAAPTQPPPPAATAQDQPPPERLRGRENFLTAVVHRRRPAQPAPAYVTPEPAEAQADAYPPPPRQPAFEPPAAPPPLAMAAPPPEPAPQPDPVPQPPMAAAAVAPAAPPAQAVAEAASPPAGTADGAAATPTGAHFYSVDRDYGLTPDPVPMPQNRPMVLIGPADGAAQSSGDSDSGADSDKSGDGDKADAAGGDD